MPKAISPLSAIISVRTWIDVHQRPPKAEDCGPRSNPYIPHYSTLKHYFSSLQEVTRYAYLLSAGDIQAWQQQGVSNTPTRTRQCLVCDQPFPWAKDVWRCSPCRKQCSLTMDEVPTLSRMALKHYGIQEEDY